MKPKKVKHTELVDALKHLKISDRKLRSSFRGFTVHGLTLFSDVLNRKSRLQLMRSASTSTYVCDIKCCSACEYCNSMRAANRLHSQTSTCLSNLPISFTKSTSILTTNYSSEPAKVNETDFSKNRFSYNFDLLDMKRSYVTEQDRTHFVSVTQSPSDVNNIETCEDRLTCCCNHDTTNTLFHSRLYRRLYSLIDHPSVSFYYLCARHICTYSTRPINSIIGNFPVRHLFLNKRHSVSPMLLNESNASYSKEAESGLNVGDVTFNHNKNFKSKVSLDSNSFVQNSPIYQSSIMHTSEYSSVMNPCRQYSYNCSGATSHTDNSQTITSQRCRRNSDPEQWQQIRTFQVSKFPSLSTYVKDVNGMLNVNVAEDDQNIDCKGICTNLENVSDLLRESSKYTLFSQTPSKSDTMPRNHLAIVGTTKDSSSLYSLNLDKSNVRNRSTNYGHFSLRSSLLDSNVAHKSAYSDQSDMPSAALTPVPTTYHQQPSGDAFMRTHNSMFSLSPSASLVNTSSNTHQSGSNISLADDRVMTNSEPNQQTAEDVSVDELASYMEHMVHIPGRMSEMAQRMYL